jgi:GrpB-like predicted nucleotidyltransferase (UPF0157 family)
MILHVHDPSWASEFGRLRSVYIATLGNLACAIEHVGSTAIQQIAAKPILDIDIVIAGESDLPAVTKKLEKLGYWHNGNQGIPGREAFKRRDEKVPYTEEPITWMNHHLYVCVRGSRELVRHILFRDYLKNEPKARAAYESIKKDIEARSNGDRKVYADLKEHEGICSAFVERILKQAEQPPAGDVLKAAPEE